ncbi:MAG: Nif3-like dinuclear metal center hexameric protein [Oscillospiraceae bacterium]|nr:Nif3-like dinuclear metal center hexameric protein [Oscillospiraceae bacterium]
MPKVKQIYEFIKTLAPEYMAMEWDHVGLLCGRSDGEVSRILVALDPFFPVAQEAKNLGCQLLLTHHAAVWQLDAVNDQSMQGQTLLYLIENGISAINAHTNLDCAPGGVNDCLAERLGLKQVEVIDPVGRDEQGRPYGLLRGGNGEKRTVEDFVRHVKEALGCDGLRYAAGSREISRVAVGGGSCSDGLKRVAELGYDAFVTADCKYNAFADAAALGLTLVDAGHFQTENPVCGYLAEKLRQAFPEVEVILSKTHGDCIKFL